MVVMGVTGSGKTTVGRRLAAELGVGFLDADDLHASPDVEAMRRGEPLDDARRGPWLDRVHRALVAHRGTGLVVACSALRITYRDRLRRGLPELRHLALVAAPDVLRARIKSRRGHFAGPDLLESQLADLELGDDVTAIDADRPVEEVVAEARRAVHPDR